MSGFWSELKSARIRDREIARKIFGMTDAEIIRSRIRSFWMLVILANVVETWYMASAFGVLAAISAYRAWSLESECRRKLMES